MKSVVISHFYNEEYLLPWWLRHQAGVFDHGILIDYGSTDRSVELIRELAPAWEVRPSRNEGFAAIECDREVMDVERGLGACWKMVLNTTEFLFASSLADSLARTDAPAIMVDAAIVIDPPALRGVEPDGRRPLPQQRHYGVFQGRGPLPVAGRSRLLHRHETGEYDVGRHATRHEATRLDDLFCLWFAYSPMTPSLMRRKLQIQGRIPQSDLAGGFGVHHVTSREAQEAVYEDWAGHASDLRADPAFGRVWNSLYA